MKIFTLILLALIGIGFSAAAQDEVVYDNSLENGWQSYGWATLNYANTSPVHSAGDSISVVDPTTSYQAIYLHHTAQSGALYQNLTFWIYPTKAGTNQVHVQATIGGNAQTSVPLSFTAAQVNSWQQISIPLTSLGIGSSASFDGFWIQNQTGAPLTFYLDDITITAVPPPSQVQLTVNSSSVVRTIDDRIYGINLAIWDSHLSSTASASLLTAMNTHAIRFPGGSSSDDYDWSTDKSISSGTGPWVNHAATFASVIQTRGAQAYVTVNYGSGTPEQAAAWVAYYNAAPNSSVVIGVDSKGHDWKTAGYWASLRAAAPLSKDDGYNFLRISRSAPFGFRYWEIGNECYGGWEYDLHGTSGSGLSGTAHDPYTYANAFQNFMQKMLAVDPTIKIGAVSTPGEDFYGTGTHGVANPNENNTVHTGWTAVVLGTLKSLGVAPHFLIHHSYAQNAGGETDAGLLQAGASVITDTANLRKMITDYMGTTLGAGIELAMTELNSVSAGPGKQTVSLVNGLFLADAIGNLAQTEFNACTWWDFRNGSDTSNNNSASLYGWRQFGDYGVVAGGDRSDTPLNTPYPPFYAAKLLTQWGRGGDRVISAASNYQLLSIAAAKLGNGNLALLVINKHPANDLAAQITLSGFTPGSATGTIYSYGKQNDTNGTDLTTGTFNASTGTFTYTFPSYSMSVLVIKSQYEAWQESAFTAAELADSTISGDNADPNRDGIPNLMEYALGLAPKSSSSQGRPSTSWQVVAGKHYLTLTFTDLSNLTDITYGVEASSDMQTWQTGSAAAVRMDNATTNQAVYRDLTAIEDAPRRFMRLRVTRP